MIKNVRESKKLAKKKPYTNHNKKKRSRRSLMYEKEN